MNVVSIVGVTSFLISAYLAWRRGDSYGAAKSLLLGFLVGFALFATDNKIDADEREIRVTALHGIYAMDWSEVKSVEVKGSSTRFYGETKVVSYNLRFPFKGKRDLKVFVNDMVQRYQIRSGPPPGLKAEQLWPMLRNARKRGWKLF